MISEQVWTSVAASTGVPGLGLLATAIISRHLTQNIPGLGRNQQFILRNRMLFVFGGIVLSCVCAGSLIARSRAKNDCCTSTYATFIDSSSNIPCNNAPVSIH